MYVYAKKTEQKNKIYYKKNKVKPTHPKNHQQHEYPQPNVYTPLTALRLPKSEDHQGVHSINLFFGGAKRSSDDDVIRLEGGLVEGPTRRLLFALCWRRMEEGPGEPT